MNLNRPEGGTRARNLTRSRFDSESEEPLGQVYRDPRTGKLILIGDDYG
jgi:hypothetical protein